MFAITNSLRKSEKMKSADSWQKDQLARNMLTNLEVNNKNEVSFRWKKPLKHVFNNASTEEFRIVRLFAPWDAPGATRTKFLVRLFAPWDAPGATRTKFLVRLTRLELAQPYGHYHLKVACIPISPQAHIAIISHICPSSSKTFPFLKFYVKMNQVLIKKV